MSNWFTRLFAIFSAKGDKAITQMEQNTMEERLNTQVRKAHDDLTRAQAGVAASYGAMHAAEEDVTRLTADQAKAIIRFKALDAQKSPNANNAAGAVTQIRADLAEAVTRRDLSKATAEKAQQTLNAARKTLEEHIAETRRNITEGQVNSQLANAIEMATGLLTQTEGTASELSNIAKMARDRNNLQKGRITAASGQLENSGLMDDQVTRDAMNEDAAASLRAELNLAPKVAPAAPAAPATEGDASTAGKQGM